ncbi:hypothetical protein ACQ4WX_37185 [Streptomyces lasalocidi]
MRESPNATTLLGGVAEDVDAGDVVPAGDGGRVVGAVRVGGAARAAGGHVAGLQGGLVGGRGAAVAGCVHGDEEVGGGRDAQRHRVGDRVLARRDRDGRGTLEGGGAQRAGQGVRGGRRAQRDGDRAEVQGRGAEPVAEPYAHRVAADAEVDDVADGGAGPGGGGPGGAVSQLPVHRGSAVTAAGGRG